MSRPPSFDEIFAVMSKASVSDVSARVVVPDDAQPDDLATRFAVALNVLLDDLSYRSADAEAAQRAAKAELARTRGMVDTALDAVVAIDAQGSVIEWNRQAEIVFGWSRDEAIGRPVAELIVPERYRAAHLAGLATFRSTGQGPVLGKRLELEALRRDGTEFPVELSITPVATPSGYIASAFVRDVSERRIADRMRLALEALRDVASLTGRALDAEGLARFVVDRARTLFGMDVASLYWWNAEHDALELMAESGGPASVPVPSLARGQGASGRALETGAPVVIPDYARYDRPAVPGVTGSAVAVPLILRDAPVGTLYVRSAAVRNMPDELVRMLALFGAQVAPILEVSRLHAELRKEQERSAMALELRRLNTELETANRELESFSYSVAHDLRAPLRSMDGFSAALLRDYEGKLDPTGQKYLRFVRQSAQEMGRLIDDLLRLSRVSRKELKRDRVDLSAVARGIVAGLREAHPDRRVDVVIQDGLVAEGDLRLLSGALENLIGNAWKFTRKRPGARIEIGRCVAEGPHAFFVRDNGAGFDMAYADKLFGVFQRLHGTHDFEGTGIGLATVQRIVRRHGGRVWAEGKVDGGATFYFTLETGPG